MKLSSKSITAIKMFIDLGEHYEEGYISLVDIAKRKELSKKFLEQIVPLFKNNNLLCTALTKVNKPYLKTIEVLEPDNDNKLFFN